MRIQDPGTKDLEYRNQDLRPQDRGPKTPGPTTQDLGTGNPETIT